MDVTPDSNLKEVKEESSLETTANYTSDPTPPPSIHVSSGANTNANTNANTDSSELSVEDVSKEDPAEPAVSITPTNTTESASRSSHHHSLFSGRHRERHHQVTHGSNRKQMRVSVAVVANPDLSSSEETE